VFAGKGECRIQKSSGILAKLRVNKCQTFSEGAIYKAIRPTYSFNCKKPILFFYATGLAL
jgi:hypothetical protein